MAKHFRFDFNGIESLSVVNTDHAADHFWDNNHVAEMCLNHNWLFTEDRLFFLQRSSIRNQNFQLLTNATYRLSESLNEGQRLPLKAAVETTASTSTNKLSELAVGEILDKQNIQGSNLFAGKIEQLLQVYSAILEFAENTLLLQIFLVSVVAIVFLHRVSASSTLQNPKEYR